MAHVWDLPNPGIEPVSPALAGSFLSIVPLGKSLIPCFEKPSSAPSLANAIRFLQCEVHYAEEYKHVLRKCSVFRGDTAYIQIDIMK